MTDKKWVPENSELEQVFLPKPKGKKGTPSYKAWAMENFLLLLKHGYNYSQAAERLGYSYRWWAKLQKEDEVWAAEARKITSGEYTIHDFPDLSHMNFEEFVATYADFRFVRHQLDMADALEDPMAKLVLILGHPESGKSTVVNLWYVLFRIATNPDVRIALVTKNGSKAQDLLTRVKRYLTEEHLYDDAKRNLIHDFGGFKPLHGDMEWSQDQIFIRQRKSGERDPTIQALGIGKQIYGARLDYLFLDDALVQDNQTSELTRERIDNWFDSEARSRAQRGQVVVSGTRLLPQDLYGMWRKAWVNHPLYREVIIPAILNEYTEDEVPSWPEYWELDGANIVEEIKHKDGTIEEVVTGYQMGLRDIRSSIVVKAPNRWKLVYQQEDVEENEAIFRQAHVDAALELGATRKLGQVFPHERLVLGVDPATTGRAASVLLAVDPTTQVRTVVDLYVGSGLGAVGVRESLLYQFWEKYKQLGHSIDVTVIETNFVKTLLGDEVLMTRADAAGTQIVDHHTTGRGKRGNKWDEEYGIAAMAPLFGGGLMAFANAGPDDRARLEPLIDDLLVFPWSKVQDAVIGLWVANTEATNATRVRLDQQSVMHRRGVPRVIRNRGGYNRSL